MPRRIILHVGFHKTGTTTVQATLRTNREAMKKHIAIRLRWHMKELVSATRGYSNDRDPLTMIKAQTRFIQMLEDLPGMPRRTLVISCEELIGHLPGRGPIKTYDCAPDLLYAFWEIAKNKFPNAEVMIYLSTRGAAPWLASAYAEHVKSSNMFMPFEDFSTIFAQAADFKDIITEIASRVPCAVHHASLESSRDLPLGPASPLLDLCDLPLTLKAELTAAPLENKRLPADVLESLRRANEKHAANPTTRLAAKKTILETYEATQAGSA